MEVPRDAESIRRVLEQAAGAAFQRAQARMENMNFRDAQNVRRLLEHAATEAIARAQEFEIPMAAFQVPAEAVEGAFVGLWPILRKIFILWAIGFSILCSSIGMYGLFYLAIQPGNVTSDQLFFDYSGIAKHPVTPPVCSNETTVEDTCTQKFPKEELRGAPWAAVDFFARHTQWEAYYHDVLPRPLTETKILKEGKGYFFEVVLELPESQINHRTGIFMVHVDLQSSNGTMLASSIRAARLPHESRWVSTIRKSIWLVPMIIGAVHETRTIVVPSFRHFRESASMPVRYATVSLVMQVKDKRRKDEPLEVTRGEIRIGEELTDFQFLLREWFFSCYAVGVIILSTLQISGLIFLKAFMKHRRHQRILRQMQEEQEDLVSFGLNLDESQLEREAEVSTEWEDLPPTVEVGVGDAPVAPDESTGLEGPAPPTPALNEEHTSALEEEEAPAGDQNQPPSGEN